MEKLVIKKRDKIALWKVNAEQVCPNTVIELEDGIVLLVKVNGQRKVCTKPSFTVNGLLNPGKESKLFGGKKPYGDCELFAVDVSSDFESEWGVAGENAMRCYDEEFDVDAKAVAVGMYKYKIQDYFEFAACFSLGEREEISRTDVREYLRSECVGVVQPYLASKIAAGLRAAQAAMSSFVEDVKFRLNKSFERKGIEIVAFTIKNLDYEPAHLANREALKKAKIGVTIKGVVNDGRRDDISVDKAASEVDIGYINAINGNPNSGEKASAKVYCSRCGEANDSKDNFCHKCGEKLHK